MCTSLEYHITEDSNTDKTPLSGECAKAEKILRSFLYPKSKKAQDEDTELGIPRAILSRAKASNSSPKSYYSEPR